MPCASIAGGTSGLTSENAAAVLHVPRHNPATAAPSPLTLQYSRNALICPPLSRMESWPGSFGPTRRPGAVACRATRHGVAARRRRKRGNHVPASAVPCGPPPGPRSAPSCLDAHTGILCRRTRGHGAGKKTPKKCLDRPPGPWYSGGVSSGWSRRDVHVNWPSSGQVTVWAQDEGGACYIRGESRAIQCGCLSEACL